MADFDSFLLDHAAAEKKASGMAISMLSHYPDRVELVSAMADLAVEELTHYREVVKWIHRRGLLTGSDRKDPYVLEFRNAIRQGRQEYLLDRLLTAGIIEARGAGRFALVAGALENGPLKKFDQSIKEQREKEEKSAASLNMVKELARAFVAWISRSRTIFMFLDIQQTPQT